MMKVAELMRTEVKTAKPDDSVGEALVTMTESHVTGLPVVDSAGRLLGVVTSTDVMVALAEREGEEVGRLLGDTSVREIMTPKPLTVPPDADVLEAAREMLYLEVHRLFVEYEGVLVGVVSQTDIVAAVATAKL